MTGYSCDSTVSRNGATCNISDPAGLHVYNSSINAVPYWVTDGNYIDPIDDSRTQFICSTLKPAATYTFRIRAYSGNANPLYGPYSNETSARTMAYPLRYVSVTGNNANDGTAPDSSHSWGTLAYAARQISCGQALIVLAGEYANDSIVMQQGCAADNKAVIMVTPGSKATITSTNASNVVQILGRYNVIDGLRVVSPTPLNEFDVAIGGDHNAILNVEVRPPVIPSFKSGLNFGGNHNLLYGSSIHDYGSPDSTQNPGGNGGFPLVVQGSTTHDNVVWSNHLTRGGHDVSLCKGGPSYNRWLNNIMDGGWGMGWEAVEHAQYNLVEGNIIFDVGQLVSFYKPSIEVSSANNTVRRNVVLNSRYAALEVSDLYSEGVQNSRVYNNTFYKSGSCYFQSHNGGVQGYDGNIYMNNICHAIGSLATDIYLGNRKSMFSFNSIAVIGSDNKPKVNARIIIWNHDASGDFQYPKTVAFADANYDPPFSKNRGLDVTPGFIDPARGDFHLSSSSPLIRAGAVVRDADWGTPEIGVDLGAFGIRLPSSHRYRPQRSPRMP
jgi:hypothetical protein